MIAPPSPSSSFSRRDVTLANWRTAPFSRWSFQNVRELVPTAKIGAGASPRSTADRPSLPDLLLALSSSDLIPLVDLLTRSHTDSLVVLKNGRLATEWHAAHVDPARAHLIFSVSKSVTGLLAGIAFGDGALDPDAPIVAYVPMPSGSAYADARVRDLLDMTVSLDFDEAYLDRDSAFDRYRRAMLWNPEHQDTKPEAMAAFLGTLGKASQAHGERFFYASPNTDLLGLVVEAAVGQRLATYLTEKLWIPLGLSGDAYVTVDREGTARTAGGICMTAHDLARIGQLVLDEGRSLSRLQIVSNAWIDDMRLNGDRQAWVDGNFADMFENGRYRSCWYEVGDPRACFAAVGIHGQWIWGDRASRVVIAKTASLPEPSDEADIQFDIAMLAQIARML